MQENGPSMEAPCDYSVKNEGGKFENAGRTGQWPHGNGGGREPGRVPGGRGPAAGCGGACAPRALGFFCQGKKAMRLLVGAFISSFVNATARREGRDGVCSGLGCAWSAGGAGTGGCKG